ncbi:MAG: flippase-like domain-containing protein [Candidatus Nomurabacteria bacterium]|jgi:uncharacterized protein (TIRG00374 family)|nr:flippase-like domain-containing protein [Candidatus Nomurabacteria bacterium]
MFKKILSVITLVLVAVVVWVARDSLTSSIGYIKTLNIWVLLFLIPEQLFMYYAAGQMYFAYIKAKQKVKVQGWKLARISLELNFVNHILPSAGVAGLGYLVWRLKEWRISAGQAVFMHILRYGIAVIATTVQMWVAMIILATMGLLPWQLFGIGAAACLGMEAVVVAVFIIIMKKKRIDWFSRVSTKAVNATVKKVTFGKKQKVLKESKVDHFFTELHGGWLVIRKKPKALINPYLWGVLYSFLEVATYWVVATALGHPEILPQLILGQGLASIVGTILATPGGVGGYEGAMIFVLVMSGVSIEIATITVIVTRVMVLLGTIVSGWGFYQHALLSKKTKPSLEELEHGALDS